MITVTLWTQANYLDKLKGPHVKGISPFAFLFYTFKGELEDGFDTYQKTISEKKPAFLCCLLSGNTSKWTNIMLSCFLHFKAFSLMCVGYPEAVPSCALGVAMLGSGKESY